MTERQLDIATTSGPMTTFICHPERNGPHPVVLFYMDAPGIREELRDMARRIASVGYYVMLPNLYHRLGIFELGDYTGPQNADVRERIMGYMATVDIPMVMDDTDSLVKFATEDPAASDHTIGTLGYCMSGRYALGAAARYPERVRAAASIYGTKLFVDGDDSPHITVRNAKAELYIACAEVDHYVPLETMAPLRESLNAAGLKAEVELYPGVEHGFAFPGRPTYHKASAERHWERVLALFARNLASR